MRFPRIAISNHGSEVMLLGLLAMGIIGLLWRAIELGIVGNSEAHGFDVAAFLLILQRIIEAIQKRWEQRGTDLANARLHASKPDPDAAGMKSVTEPEGEQA